jgi:hypothetical protein
MAHSGKLAGTLPAADKASKEKGESPELTFKRWLRERCVRRPSEAAPALDCREVDGLPKIAKGRKGRNVSSRYSAYLDAACAIGAADENVSVQTQVIQVGSSSARLRLLAVTTAGAYGVCFAKGLTARQPHCKGRDTPKRTAQRTVIAAAHPVHACSHRSLQTPARSARCCRCGFSGGGRAANHSQGFDALPLGADVDVGRRGTVQAQHRPVLAGVPQPAAPPGATAPTDASRVQRCPHGPRGLSHTAGKRCRRFGTLR